MLALVAVCVVLAVVAAVLVVVVRDDDSAAAESVRPADVLTERQLALVRKAVPDPKCDAAVSAAAPGDTSLVALDVMRVDGTCLSTVTEYLPAVQVASRQEALARDPAVVASAEASPMSPDSVRLPAVEDHRDDQWPLDVLGVPHGSTDMPWPDGTGVVVAVLDTGVDATHPDLAGAVIGRRHYTGEGAPDPDGHGTHVAGIIAARDGNGGITGVAPGVSILDVPVWLKNANDRGPSWLVGLTWAVNHGADVVNMSFGQSLTYLERQENSPTLGLGAAAVEFAHNSQVVLVAAGGNCGARVERDVDCERRDERQIPSVFEGVVNVGAIDDDRELTGYSTKNDDIHLVAPGGDNSLPVNVLTGGEVLSDAPDGGFARMMGTSQAAPHVTAAAAIGRFVRPDASADDIVRALLDSADQNGISEDDRGKKGTGHGLLDIPGMVEQLRLGPSTPPSTPPANPTPTPNPTRTPTAPGTAKPTDPTSLAARTQAAYVQDGTLYAYDGTTARPVRRMASTLRWLAWSSDHTLLVGADQNTLFSWAGPGTQVVEKPCDWCGEEYNEPVLVDNAAVTDPSGGARTGDLIMHIKYDGTLTRYNAHTLDEIGSSPTTFPPQMGGDRSLHGAIGGQLLAHDTGGAHTLARLWLLDPVSNQAGPSHEVQGAVLGETAVSADGTKVAAVTGYADCGQPEGIYVLAAGDLRELAKVPSPDGLMVDELYFNGPTLYANMSTFAMSPGQPCVRISSVGRWRLDGTTWQRVDQTLSTGRPLEGRPGTTPTGWITVRGGTAFVEPAAPIDLDKGELGPVDGPVWSTPTRTEVLVPPPR